MQAPHSVPLKVAVHGASGRLGHLIVAQLQQPDTDQNAAQNPPPLRYAGPVPRSGPVPHCDLVIDVSSAQGTANLLGRLQHQALLVGTTGDLPLAALETYGQHTAVALVSNFSAGIPLLIDIVEELVSSLPGGWQIEVVEAHHVMKKDAPSGTAKRLVRAIGRDDVPTHSLRLGDTVGEHRVILAGPGERLELTHVATRREVFAIGALRHAAWLARQPPGLYRP